MKKILPFLSLVGASVIITGCSNNLTCVNLNNKTNENIKEFFSSVNAIPEIKNAIQTSVNNKYNLTVDTPKTLELTEDNIIEENNLEEPEIIENNNLTEDNETENNIIPNNNQNSEQDENITNPEQDEDKNTQDDNISTLYSISSDVETSCEDFCELKEEITEAIAETERLIDKLETNEIELSREQRIILSEQAMQLKNLGKQLSITTTHLAFNLSDLKQVLNENNADVNALSLKYLIVLDNLVNSNEMLQSGLTTLNMMNQMLYKPNNGESRMILGYKQNDNPPVIKDYSINENGEITENKPFEENDTDNTVLDTYNNSGLNTNIDSYHSNNPKNIDSFFNTALLDNEFMYGNGGLYGGFGGYSYGMNPYMNHYTQYERNQNNNTTQGGINNNNTQDTNNQLDEDGEKLGNKERKKFNIKKNIDTYRDENTPDLKTRFKNFKQSLTNAFGKVDPKNDIKRPIYKY